MMPATPTPAGMNDSSAHSGVVWGLSSPGGSPQTMKTATEADRTRVLTAAQPSHSLRRAIVVRISCTRSRIGWPHSGQITTPWSVPVAGRATGSGNVT
jgi:hypothetical protein